MDNEEYASNTFWKLSEYNKHEFLQGDNLICTYENNSTPLQISLVEDIIEHYFL